MKSEEEISFKIIKEVWNEYELADGSKIKARIILTRVLGNPEIKSMNFEFLNPIFVISSKERGNPGNEPQPHEYDKLPQEEIEIKTPLEYWNEYELPTLAKKIKIKYVISGIFRLIDRFNNQGYPFYVINGGPLIEQ